MGAPASSMDLELFSTSDTLLQKLDDDNALLGSYPVDDDCRIHVRGRALVSVVEMEKQSRGTEDEQREKTGSRV